MEMKLKALSVAVPLSLLPLSPFPFYPSFLPLPSENSVTPSVERDGGKARCPRARGALGWRGVRLHRLRRVGRDVREGCAARSFDYADEGLRREVNGDDDLLGRVAAREGDDARLVGVVKPDEFAAAQGGVRLSQRD